VAASGGWFLAGGESDLLTLIRAGVAATGGWFLALAGS
jgi:hypothetical protein